MRINTQFIIVVKQWVSKQFFHFISLSRIELKRQTGGERKQKTPVHQPYIAVKNRL
jgi:hypothetical protein